MVSHLAIWCITFCALFEDIHVFRHLLSTSSRLLICLFWNIGTTSTRTTSPWTIMRFTTAWTLNCITIKKETTGVVRFHPTMSRSVCRRTGWHILSFAGVLGQFLHSMALQEPCSCTMAMRCSSLLKHFDAVMEKEKKKIDTASLGIDMPGSFHFYPYCNLEARRRTPPPALCVNYHQQRAVVNWFRRELTLLLSRQGPAVQCVFQVMFVRTEHGA